MMSGEKQTYVIYPIDPESGKLALELMCLAPSKELCELFCMDLKALGYRFVTLPVQTFHNLTEFRELWREAVANNVINKIKEKH